MKESAVYYQHLDLHVSGPLHTGNKEKFVSSDCPRINLPERVIGINKQRLLGIRDEQNGLGWKGPQGSYGPTSPIKQGHPRAPGKGLRPGGS